MLMEIKQVESKKYLREFIRFQFDHYKNDRYWVPPMIKDETGMLSHDINPAFQFCESAFWMVKQGGKYVGRTGAGGTSITMLLISVLFVLLSMSVR